MEFRLFEFYNNLANSCMIEPQHQQGPLNNHDYIRVLFTKKFVKYSFYENVTKEYFLILNTEILYNFVNGF